MKKLKMILTAAIVAAATGSAFAIPTLTISDGATSTTLTSASGIITFGSSFDSFWTVLIVTGETKPALGSASHPQMDLNIQASSSANSTLNPLTITLSDDSFGPGPTSGNAIGKLTGSVTPAGGGQNLSFSTFFSTANTIPATTPLTTTGSIAPVAGGYNPPNQVAAFNQPGSYSLTEQVIINGSQSASGLYNLDATLVIPEPSSLCLLLAGGAVFGVWRRRK